MRTVGVVVNPIAGMGGRVGLKGTDGKVAAARERGAEPRAPERARAALVALRDHAPETRLLTFGDPMGAAEARAAGFDPDVVGEPARAPDTAAETTAEDTRAAVAAFVDRGADLVLFVGGDGTATDVAQALDDLDADVPVLGVPAGVKVYSSVFAVRPEAAGRVAATFEETETREVSDIDEDAYRDGEVRTRLRGVVEVPVAEDLQSAKQVHSGSTGALAAGVAASVEDGVTYVLGPGGTVGRIAEELGVDGSPLGVDVYRDGELVVQDGSENEILGALGDENVVYVSPIGGQGFVFGRGNHQISPAVIERSEVRVVASPRKLDETGVLRVDTGDEGVDESLRGWTNVRVGRFEERMVKVV
ncbi:ATP-NAD kinase family protein [Halobacterium jilantaiense]|uniref:Predicted polyphosphate-or ATP-dependent NAD kinase n=1 Tax=Halobacterium jilantaiense TaxID=355548 RepID=A0A1I0N7F6_9EURY|nr:ATP-NAD kinase family protein [Halobacterium jilantaiense]SEV97063.1 Predicted polyphosphate-or ATP-dependent NAD kinase [Halobacterium jilantaiense]